MSLTHDNPFKVYILMIWGSLIESCKHHHSAVLDRFHHPQKFAGGPFWSGTWRSKLRQLGVWGRADHPRLEEQLVGMLQGWEELALFTGREEAIRAGVQQGGKERALVFRTSRGFSVSCTACGPRRLINARWPLFFSLSSSLMAEMHSPNLMVEERNGQAFQALCVQPHLVFVTLWSGFQGLFFTDEKIKAK